MGLSLGIDVGTTFTAAAVWRDERIEVVALEAHRVTIPTVIFTDGTDMWYGDAAVARAASNPDAVAREFKRRLGDPVAIIIGGAPFSADRLVALFAKRVIETIAAQFGEQPERITVTHPANWTEFQRHLLASALEQVGLENVALLNEPQAAAIDFASVAHVEPGQLVLVYDLGGGTFDLALLRREDDGGFTLVGDAAGAERLGGIDFDEAVLQHVLSHVPPDVVERVRTEQTGRMALAQLRSRCVEAKEALSGDVAVDVPVVLPGFSTTVRVTRTEFEAMIRPMILQTVDLARRVLDRSDVAPEDLSAALLVGGSSRIPLVSELVGAGLGAPVRVDAHPKLVVARGAARWAASLPLNASPGSSPARSAHRPHDPERQTGRRKLALVIGTAAVVAVLVIGIIWVVSSSGGSNGQAGVTSTAGPGTTTAGSVAGGDVSLPAIPAGVAQRVTYTIDPAAVWDDGTPITVRDFECTRLANLNTPGTRTAALYDDVAAVTAGVSDRQVVVDFDTEFAPYRLLFDALLQADAFADCNDVSAEMSSDIPFSGGEFALASWGEDGGQLVRNERYWGPAATFATVQVTSTPTFDAEVEALHSDAVDFIYPSLFANMPDAVSALTAADVSTAVEYGEDLELLLFQAAAGPLADPTFRQAFAMSVDHQAIFDQFYGPVLGGSLALCGPVVPGPYCADDFAASFDPEGATALLTDGGWTKDAGGLWTNAAGDVPQVRFVIADGNTRRHGIQDFMIADMRERGFDVVTDNCPRGADCDARLRQLDYDVTIRYAKAPPDPSHLTPSYSCSEVPTSANGFAGANWSGWCNEQASAALLAADETVDDAARTTLVQEAVAAMAEDAALLPLYQFPRLGAYRTDRIGGDIAADLGNHDAFANFATWEDVDGDGVLRIGAEQVPSCLSPVTCPSNWQRWLVQTSVFPRVFAPQADGTFAMTPLVADVTVQTQDG